MFAAFPSPVLSVAADVVRDLDEYEALPGLWTLFTKCKGSLKDGQRLENISWRLWYREMMAVPLEHHQSALVCDSEKHTIEGGNSLDNVYRPPTPEEAVQGLAVNPESPHLSSSQPSPLPDFLIPTLHSRLSVNSTPANRRSSASSRKSKHTRTGVGKIICDLLPNSLPLEVLRHKSSRQVASALPSQPTTMTAQGAGLVTCDLPVVKDVKVSFLPSPLTDGMMPHASSLEMPPHCPDAPKITPVQLSRVQDPSTPELPALTILDASDPPAPVISAPNLNHTSPGSSPRNPDLSFNAGIVNPNGLTLPPPRLIVVNPTPNLTPHPTPPATPVLQNTSPQLIGALVPSDNQHLVPPPAFHVVSAQKDKMTSSQRRSVVQNDSLAVELTPNRAKAEPPRIPGEGVQVHIPPSPTLTDDAIVPQCMTQFLDQNRLHHPLTVSTMVEPVTKKPSVLMLVPSSPSVVAHIFGEPAYMGKTIHGTRSRSSSPTKGNANESVVVTSPTKGNANESAVVTSPTADSEKATTSPRPGPVRRQNSVGVKTSSSGPKKLPRTHSIGNVVTLNNGAGTHTRNGSRSRSRDGSGPGLGAGALAMTRAASTGPAGKPKAKVVGGTKAITSRLGVRKTGDKSKERPKLKEKKAIENEHDDKDHLKRPTFNIGSGSDEGSGVGSKSIGSGSEVLDAPNPVGVNEQVELAKVQEEERIKENEDGQGPENVQVVVNDNTILGAEALFEALLPQQQKLIVVASSDSGDDFETDDGSWSSEELSGVEAEVAKSGDDNATKDKPQPQPQPQQQRQQQQRQQQQQQQQQQRPPIAFVAPVAFVAHVQVDDAARLKHLPTNPLPPHAHHSDKRSHLGRLSRRQHLLNQAKHTQSLEQAALEAQRQREMFAKIPTSQNIARTRSVGLLTQLMNPDPYIFHPNHPYRRGFSSTEVRSQHQDHVGQVQPRLPGAPAMTNVSNQIQPNPSQAEQAPSELRIQDTAPAKAVPPAVPPAAVPPVPVVAAPEVRRPVSAHQPPRQFAAPSFRPNKVPAAVPVASQVQVGSLRSNSSGDTGVLLSQPGLDQPPFGPRLQTNERPAGGYRPRGRPEDAELEEESGTEEESSIQVSKSVAQEKLRVLAERRGIRPNRRASTENANPQPLPAWAEQSGTHIQESGKMEGGREFKHPVLPQQQQQQQQLTTRPPGPVRMHTTPTPIPQALAHPYNLPLAALPTTPRTTRRHMLQTEMSESLRRNLLWERQVSKNNILGFRRTASSGGGARGNVLNGIRPFAKNDPVPAPPNVVQLTAKGSKNHNNNPNPNEAGNLTQDSSKAFARNRSWAGEEDDYHRKGW